MPADPSTAATDTERFALRRHRVVNAGAGTGKTHALLTQYLHLVAGFSALPKPLEPRAIAALTFTEKAAAELRERLGRRLLAIVRGSGVASQLQAIEPDLCRSAALLGRSWPPPEHFEAARAQLSQAPIGTFHSFAAAVLRRHALAAGIEPDFDLLDQETASDLLGESCERAVLAALDGEGGDATAQGTADLVTEFGFAGDHGLVAALCRLLSARGEAGSGDVALDAAYQPAALDEDRQRLVHQVQQALAAVGEVGPDLSGKSAERVAQAQALAPDLQAALSSLDGLDTAVDRLAVLRATLKSVTSRRDDLRHTVTAARDRLKAASEDLDALLVSRRAAPLSQAMDWLLADSQRRYDEAKRVLSALDFSDLLRRTRDLLRDDTAVRTREQGRSTVLLVDEFQDTSPLQAEILSLLIDTAADSHAPSRPLYIVGDRKQSIYGFRGADVAAYERVCQRLLADGADEQTLRTSRRSRPALIDFTNALFARVFAPPADESPDDAGSRHDVFTLVRQAGQVQWDDARDSLQAFREESPLGRPLVEVLAAAGPAAARSDADDDGSASQTEAPTAADAKPTDRANPKDAPGDAPDDAVDAPDDPIGRESQLVALRMQELLASGTRARDIVLLLRRFTHLLRYTGALTQAGIPHYVVRGRGFFAAQEVLDLASFLSLVDDPQDRLALLSVLRSPLCALSDDTLVQLHLSGLLTLPALQRAHAGPADASTAAIPPLPSDERARLDVLLTLLSQLRDSAARLGPATCLQLVLDRSDYLALLCAEGGGSGASLGQQRIANVGRLQERAAAHEARGGTLGSFVRALRQSTDPRVASGYGEGDDPLAPIAGESDDVVRVMTIHQSKGLEFPVVFLAGCASPERSESPAISYDRHIGLGLRLWQGDVRVAGGLSGKRVPTLAARRIQALARARSQAESCRLFYVAATRASERLLFTGESRRSSRGTWRAAIDDLAADHPELVRRVTPAPTPPPPPHDTGHADAGALSVDSPVLVRNAEAQVRRVYAPLLLTPPAGGLSVSLSAAADLLACPRRYHLRHRLLLHEQDAALPPSLGDDPPGALPLAALAVSLLRQEDLSQLRSAPAEAVLLRGHDPRNPSVGELITRLARVAATPLFDRLCASAGPMLQRAVDFDVPLGRLRLRDSFDWVLIPRDGAAQSQAALQVVRFRYGYSPDRQSPLAQLHDRLLAWAARQYASGQTEPPRTVHSSHCDLREPQPEPRFRDAALPSPQLDALCALADERVEAACRSPLFALSAPTLPRSTCDTLHCGYRYLCFRSPALG